MKIDINTATVLLSITNCIQVIALFAQYRLYKTHRGPGWWALGNAALALGFFLNYLRNTPVVGEIFIVANNLLFTYGLALFYVGILHFFDLRVRASLIITFCTVFTFIILYFTYGIADLAIRRFSVSVAIAVLSLLMAQSLFRQKLRFVTESAHFLATVALIGSGFFSLRAVVTVVYGVPTGNAFAATPMQSATYLITFTMTALLTFGFIMLVNQRLNAENREANENLELIFNTSPDAVLITRLNDGYFVAINEGFTRLSGFTRAEVIGKSILEVNIWQDRADREQFIAQLQEHGYCEHLEYAFQRKDGSQRIGMLSAKIIPLQGEPHIVSVTHDITAYKRLQAELQQQATTDELTGICNRRHFLVLAQAELKRAQRLADPVSITLIDIDYFKQINDTHGHVGGDHALQAFTAVCQQNIREVDVFARFGGDEFALLLPKAQYAQAYEVVERIRLALATVPIDCNGTPVVLTISAGIAGQTSVDESLDSMLGRADQALYRSKEAGRNCVTIEYATEEVG